MKILLPVDGSHVTKRMLSYIAAHDELLGPGHEYTVVTVLRPVPGFPASFVEKQVLEGYYAEEAEKVLQPIRSFVAQQGWNARLLHSVGRAPDTIARMATEDGFDLVAMGAHGHSSLANVVIGSVASGVLARCTTPVLLIR